MNITKGRIAYSAILSVVLVHQIEAGRCRTLHRYEYSNMNGSVMKKKFQSIEGSACMISFKKNNMQKYNSSLLVLIVNPLHVHVLSANGFDPTFLFLATVICVVYFSTIAIALLPIYPEMHQYEVVNTTVERLKSVSQPYKSS